MCVDRDALSFIKAAGKHDVGSFSGHTLKRDQILHAIRHFASEIIDNVIYIFGGKGYGTTTTLGGLNDLWEYHLEYDCFYLLSFQWLLPRCSLKGYSYHDRLEELECTGPQDGWVGVRGNVSNRNLNR